MNTIESMAEEIRKAIYTLEQGKPCKAICEEMRQKLDMALTAYKSGDWTYIKTDVLELKMKQMFIDMVEPGQDAKNWIPVRRDRLGILLNDTIGKTNGFVRPTPCPAPPYDVEKACEEHQGDCIVCWKAYLTERSEVINENA